MVRTGYGISMIIIEMIIIIADIREREIMPLGSQGNPDIITSLILLHEVGQIRRYFMLIQDQNCILRIQLDPLWINRVQLCLIALECVAY